MIYTEEASFPYPIICSNSTDYVNNKFFFDIDVKSNNEFYSLQLNIQMESDFLKELLKFKKIEYYVIIKTQDSNFYKLPDNNILEIAKTKLSFKSNSKIQLILKSSCELDFKDNYDIDSFYTDDNESIIIDKNSIVGFSNVVIFDRSEKTTVDLFEKKIDKSIPSEIKIEIRDENIVLIFKDEKYQYGKVSESKRLNYPYIYIGLQRLLMEMIVADCKNQENVLEINKNSISNASKGVYRKIVRLLENKGISQLSFEDIDDVINKISPNIISEYYKGVMGVCKNED
ncbi:MAG: hypothetical protein ACRCZO_06685 [Cetobacterium sp.]